MALWTACALLLLLATTGCSGAPGPGELEDVPEEDPAAPSPSPSPAVPASTGGDAAQRHGVPAVPGHPAPVSSGRRRGLVHHPVGAPALAHRRQGSGLWTWLDKLVRPGAWAAWHTAQLAERCAASLRTDLAAAARCCATTPSTRNCMMPAATASPPCAPTQTSARAPPQPCCLCSC